jgi:hypothetical protein
MAMIELDQEEEHAAVTVAPQEDKVQQVEPKGESDLLFPIDIFLGCTILRIWQGARRWTIL